MDDVRKTPRLLSGYRIAVWLLRRSSVIVGNSMNDSLKRNPLFGDNQVESWENLLDHKPQNLL